MTFFYFLEDLGIADYTDNTAIYTVKENKESVINTSEASSLPFLTWFNNNFLKTNLKLLLYCSEPSTSLIDGSFHWIKYKRDKWLQLDSNPESLSSWTNTQPFDIDIQTTIECGFTLKRVRDMTRTCSQMHRTDKYSEHSSIIWPVWPNGWVFV